MTLYIRNFSCPINEYTNFAQIYQAYLDASWEQYMDFSSIKTTPSVFTSNNSNPFGWIGTYNTPFTNTHIPTYDLGGVMTQNNYSFQPVKTFGWSTICGQSPIQYNLGLIFSGFYGLNTYNPYQIQANSFSNLYNNRTGTTTHVTRTTPAPAPTTAQSVSKSNTQATIAQTTVPTLARQNQGQTNIEENRRFAKAIADNAENYIGYNEKDGSYRRFSNSSEWCADFVSYVVKETYAKKGKTVPSGFGSWRCENLKQWAISNNKFLQISGLSDRASAIAQNVKPGDILILRENGASHTGIVRSVDPKTGNFTTIEGNVRTKEGIDKVIKQSYSPNNAEISGFIQLV